VVADSDPEALLECLMTYTPPYVDKWLDRSQT
jgi:hypothetical protein